MLYSILKLLVKITVRVFFKSITIRNKELIPAKGPLMVLSNHPSTFMDPLVVATMLNREVFFLAKGALFANPLASWLLPKLNIIPLYRQKDDPSQMNKNQDSFLKCFEHLEKNGAILMFPEGTSITERRLRPIKTGAARITLEAEARNNFQLGINIITIGLNYANPHRFNRDLFINIDSPIRLEDYQQHYQENAVETVNELTEDIRKKMEKLIIAIEDDKTDELVRNVELLYKYKLTKEQGISNNDKKADFTITQGIVDAVNYNRERNPFYVEKMRQRIEGYLNSLKRIGLDDADIAKSQNSKSFVRSNLKAFLLIVTGFPFYLYGMLNNILPFEIPARIAKKVSSTIEFVGAIGMVGGMFTYMIFYPLQIILVWKIWHSTPLTVIYGISLPITGIFAFWYYHTVKRIRTKWILMILFYKKSAFISNLIIEREQIIAEFDKIKNEYANRNS